MRVSAVMMFILFSLTGLPTLAQDASGQDREAFARQAEETVRNWEALRDSQPRFREMFCQPRKPVCVGDWDELRSPLGGWRVIDPQTCAVDLAACPFGPAVDLSEFADSISALPTGPVEGWAPCDVFEGADPSVLVCDDICGCSILKANCAGTFDCTSDVCTCR